MEFIEPTTASRCKLAVLAAAVALGLGVLHFALTPYVNALPRCERFPLVQGFLVVLIGAFPLFGLWALWYAQRLLKLNQLPLPGAWVWRRTPVRRGRTVRVLGWALLAWSLAALSTPLLAWYLIARGGLLSTPPQCAPCIFPKTTRESEI